MSKIKSNQITSRAHKGTLVIGDTHDKVQFHHEAEVFIPGYATKEYVDDVASNVEPHENPVFHLNDTELFVDYQIPSGKNAGTFGPLDNNASVNVPDDSTWTIVGNEDTTAHAGYLRDLADTDIPMVPNDDSFLHYDSYTDKWKPKTLNSISGNDGNDGEDGEDGASAYEIAVENGFVGTEQEWLDSLKGEQGDPLDYNDLTPEQIEALKGDKGDDGLSAYEIAVKDGFTGTEAQWLASLKGDKGDDGEDGEDGEDGSDFTYDDLTPEQIEALKGEDGQDGQDGKDFTYDDFTPEQIEGLEGEKGETGEDGKGWKSDGTGYNSSTGKVTFASDDGLGFETGDLRGEKGSPGDGIHVKGSVDDKAELPDSGNEVGDAYINNSDGDLYIWGDDGAWHDAGHVVGPPGPEGEDAYEVWEHAHPGETEAAFIEDITGEKGDPFTYDDFTTEQLEDLKGDSGDQGEDGKSAYELAVEGGYTESESEWLASLKGEKGDDGQDGEDGEDGVGFEYDDLTPEQIESLKGDQGETGANSYEFWLQSNPGGTEAQYWESLKGDQGDKGDDFTYNDFTPEQLAGLKGDQGDTGEGQTVSVGDVTTVDPKADGTHGNASISTNVKLTTDQNLVLDFAIPAGDKGDEGLPGIPGDSAYTVAINNGFAGTEEEWLESLKGEDGEDAEGGGGDVQGLTVKELDIEDQVDQATRWRDADFQSHKKIGSISCIAYGQGKFLVGAKDGAQTISNKGSLAFESSDGVVWNSTLPDIPLTMAIDENGNPIIDHSKAHFDHRDTAVKKNAGNFNFTDIIYSEKFDLWISLGRDAKADGEGQFTEIIRVSRDGRLWSNVYVRANHGQPHDPLGLENLAIVDDRIVSLGHAWKGKDPITQMLYSGKMFQKDPIGSLTEWNVIDIPDVAGTNDMKYTRKMLVPDHKGPVNPDRSKFFIYGRHYKTGGPAIENIEPYLQECDLESGTPVFTDISSRIPNEMTDLEFEPYHAARNGNTLVICGSGSDWKPGDEPRNIRDAYGIVSTDNGETWKRIDFPIDEKEYIDGTGYISAVAYGNGVFVAMVYSATGGPSQSVIKPKGEFLISKDGVNWKWGKGARKGYYLDGVIAYGRGIFVSAINHFAITAKGIQSFDTRTTLKTEQRDEFDVDNPESFDRDIERFEPVAYSSDIVALNKELNGFREMILDQILYLQLLIGTNKP